MPFSTSFNNSVLDHWTERTTMPAMTNVWVGLSSTTPTAAGTNVTEPTVGAYARIRILSTEMDAAAAGLTTNNAQIDFPTATANWGAALTHAVFYSAVTAGTFIGFSALTTARTVLSGDPVRIPVGDLDITAGGT